MADAVCRARLRSAAGAHPSTVTDAEFDLFGRHVVPPAPEDGFTVVVHRA
ncbi:hypothetical protein ACLBXO_10245 [Methylobacterium sp. C33D]